LCDARLSGLRSRGQFPSEKYQLFANARILRNARCFQPPEFEFDRANANLKDILLAIPDFSRTLHHADRSEARQRE
jgi:hypothetical protein